MNVQAAFCFIETVFLRLIWPLRDYTRAETAAESEKQPAPVKMGCRLLFCRIILRV